MNICCIVYVTVHGSLEGLCLKQLKFFVRILYFFIIKKKKSFGWMLRISANFDFFLKLGNGK